MQLNEAIVRLYVAIQNVENELITWSQQNTEAYPDCKHTLRVLQRLTQENLDLRLTKYSTAPDIDIGENFLPDLTVQAVNPECMLRKLLEIAYYMSQYIKLKCFCEYATAEAIAAEFIYHLRHCYYCHFQLNEYFKLWDTSRSSQQF